MSDISKQDKIVAAVVIACGLIFFGLLASKCNPLDSPSDSETGATTPSTTESVHTPSDGNEGLEELKSQLTKLNQEITDLKQLNQSLTTSLDEYKQSEQQPNDDSSNPTLANEALRSKNAELESSLAQAEMKAKLLTAQTVELTTVLDQVSSLIQPKDSESLHEAVSRMVNQSKSAANSLTKTQEEFAELKRKYTQIENQTPETQDEAIKKQLTDLRKERDDAETKINILEAKLTQQEAEAEHTSKLILAARKQQSVIQSKNKQILSLKAQINQINATTKPFVESSEALPTSAKNLFDDLKKLEGKPQTDNEKAYKTIQKQHKATSLMRIQFASGKAEISAADIAKIKEVSNKSSQNAYFLVVGFADNTGSADANKILSSKRSTNVAKELNNLKKGFQAAQAVYLGQTTRFGEPEQNRVVEIWRIN